MQGDMGVAFELWGSMGFYIILGVDQGLYAGTRVLAGSTYAFVVILVSSLRNG